MFSGDSAYPFKSWLMTPVNRNAHNPEVQRFNQAHKSTRSVVENSIGILKEKFPRLNHLRVDPTFACEIFKACTVLCNLSKDLQPQGNQIVDMADTENPPEPEQQVAEPEPQAEARLAQLLQYFQ